MTKVNTRFTIANSISLPNAPAHRLGLFALGGQMLTQRLNPDARLTASQAALLAGVTKQLVNYWRVKGHLKPQADGRYRVADVLSVEAKMRKAPQSTRNTSMAV